MNGKKALPLLVIASMILALIPSMMFANAAFGFTNFLSVTDGVEGGAITSGAKGDVVAAIGTGATAGTTMGVYWDDPNLAWNGVKGLLNSTTVKSSGNFDVWFTVPEATNGAHYLWFKDSSNSIYGPYPVAGFTVIAKIKLSPKSGLAGDTITATMYGFPKSAEITISFGGLVADAATPTANSIGTATATFKVPAAAVSNPPTIYTITAANGTVTATAPFSAGPVITLSATSGTVGQVVTITGRGFIPGEDIVAGDVVLGTKTAYITTETPITVDATGRIRLNVVVPETGDKDTFTFTLASAAGTAQADFDVTALSKVSVTPSFGPVASSITVSGVNYPKIAGVSINVELQFTNGTMVNAVGTVKTLADGTFSKTFKVPAASEGGYNIAAFNTVYNIADTAGFKVGTMNLILSDDTGPTGMTVTISGNGFTHSKTWNATFGSKTIIDSGAAVSAAGLLEGGEFMVPQLPVGTYTITVWDEDAEISLTTQFQITKTTTVTLSVPSAPNGFNVTLRGYGFNDQVQTDADFVIYNKTSTGGLDFWWTLTTYNLPDGGLDIQTNSTGEFYGYWIVPDAEILSKGNYFMNVTDASGDYAVTIPFSVGDVHLVAAPRKPSFKVGETISFILEYSFPADVDQSILKIYDPSGALVYSGDELTVWTKTGLWYTAPYSSQTAGGNPMVIADDAPLGTWTWKWINNDGDTAASGSLTVAASDASATDAKITALATQITALQTAVSTAVAGAQTAATQAGTKADAATAAATAAGAKADAATAAATAAGTKADAATAAATAAAASAKSAADAASGLTTLVYAAIGASLIAALAAIVALMQISRKIA